MAKVKAGNGYVTFNPKIGPEPSIRAKYKGYKQYDVIKGGKVYTLTSNKKNIVVFCHPELNKYKNKNIKHMMIKEDYKLVADEQKEIWNL